MNLIQLIDSEWDHFVSQHPAAHLLQLSGWGKLKSRFEWSSDRVALAGAEGAPEVGSLLLFRNIGWRGIGLTLAYAPKGPLVNWQDQAQTTALLTQIDDLCRQRGASTFKIEPELPDTPANREILHSYGFRPSQQTIQPRSTTFLDISGDEASVLARMKQKWRYNVRLAEKKGITVRPATASDLPAFNRLMTTTGQRDGFAVHSAEYYQAAWQLLTPDHGVYLLAEFEGEPIAGIVVCAVGKLGWYLWGASGEKERNRMPNHALQWAGIKWARQQGAICYDFWGIPDEIGEMGQTLRNGDGSGTPVDEIELDLDNLPSHGLWGVYRFKQGFGGHVVRYIGAWDRPIRQPGHLLYTTGLWARQKLQERRATNATQSPSHPVPPTHGVPAPHPAPALTLIEDASQWRAILATLPNPHVLQSWEWGQVKGQTEWHAERLVLSNDGAISGKVAFQFLWRQPIPYVPLRVGYVPKGPVIDWEDERTVTTALTQVIAQARQRGCLFVKIDPDVRADSAAGQRLLAYLRSSGWRFSADQIQFKNTAFSDLRPSEDRLLEGMKQKWRYNIRLAEKRGIVIRQATIADLAAFYELYAETSRRDGFLIRPYDYYKTTWETFLTAQQQPGNPAGGALLLAEHPEESKPLGGVFLFRYGQRSWYFFGASSEVRRRDMPNYLLQWQAMRWSIGQGCTTYDWWGAPTHVDDPADGMQGVWQFKQGFGAEFQEHVGAWDYPIWPLLYDGYTRVWPLVLGWLRRAAGK